MTSRLAQGTLLDMLGTRNTLIQEDAVQVADLDDELSRMEAQKEGTTKKHQNK